MATTLVNSDRADMLGAIGSLPRQLRDTWQNASRAAAEAIAARTDAPRSLVLCGMGGSGVGGDLLAATFASRCPVVPVKGYDVPSWVSTDDAVVCVSYSGNTSETLSCFGQAQSRGGVAAVITSGGQLGERADAAGVPVLTVPAGYQPRAAVGVLYATLAAAAQRLAVVSDAASVVELAAAGAQRVVDAHESPADDAGEPPALAMARTLQDRIVIVYGAGASTAVAHRWKAQINENGKVPAFAADYPELDHNELVGWQYARESGGRWALVELVMAETRPELVERMDITSELSADAFDALHRLEARSDSLPGCVFELLTFGDYVSTYLALLRGIDPSPVERIIELKERLGGR